MFTLKLRPRLGEMGFRFIKAAPTLIIIYGVLLSSLQAIPVKNPNANLERLALLQQQLALLVTLDGFLIYSLARDFLRGKFRVYF